jgi:hypothetical protein
MRPVSVLAVMALITASAAGSAAAAQPKGSFEFAVSYPVSQSSVPLDGRVILLLSRDLAREPRMSKPMSRSQRRTYSVSTSKLWRPVPSPC